MKDGQLKVLNEHNARLLENLNNVEEDANTAQLEKLAVEDENRRLRDENFAAKSEARSAHSELLKVKCESVEKDKQLHVLTDQNSELLRLLETEESQTAKLSAENETHLRPACV